MEDFAQRLAHIDRRIIFSLVGLLCLAPLVIGFQIPSIISPPALALYEAVEKTPPDKLVVLSTSWDPGTMPENGPQTEALMAHLFRLKRRFAILSMGAPLGPTLGQQIAERVAKEYGAQYGRDWVNWGLKVGQ